MKKTRKKIISAFLAVIMMFGNIVVLFTDLKLQTYADDTAVTLGDTQHGFLWDIEQGDETILSTGFGKRGAPTLTTEAGVFTKGANDYSLKIVGTAGAHTGLSYSRYSGSPGNPLTAGDTVIISYDVAFNDASLLSSSHKYYFRLRFSSRNVDLANLSGSKLSYGMSTSGSKPHFLGTSVNAALSSQTWYNYKMSFTLLDDGYYLLGRFYLDGAPIYEGIFQASDGGLINTLNYIDFTCDGTGTMYLDNISIQQYEKNENYDPDILNSYSKSTATMINVIDKSIDFASNPYISAEAFLSSTQNVILKDDLGNTVTDSTPLRFLNVYESKSDGTLTQYTSKNIPSNYSKNFWNMDTASYPGVWGTKGSPSLSIEENIYSKSDYALKIAGTGTLSGLDYYINSSKPASSISSLEKFELSLDLALSAVEGKDYYCQFMLNSGATVIPFETSYVYKDYGIRILNGRIYFLGVDTKYTLSAEKWYNMNVSLVLTSDNKTMIISLMLDGEEIHSGKFTIDSGNEITGFYRMNVLNNSSSDMYIDNLSMRHYHSSETGFNASANDIVASITSAPIIDYENKTLIWDALIPSYFTAEVISSNEEIISSEGALIVPNNTTDVTVSLKLSSALNESDFAVSTSFVVTVLSECDRIAAAIDLLKLPDPMENANKIIFPTVPEGYSIRISETSNADIVDLEGNIKRTTETTSVRLKFEVINNDNGVKAETEALLFPVYKNYVAPSTSQSEIDQAKLDYEAKKYGAFVHYVPGTVYADNTKVLSIDDLANNFNAQKFAKDMHDFGVEYVVFTAWHGLTLSLFPSMTNERWRDDRRDDVANNKKTYSDRDVIDELLDALEPFGIELHLYVHPSEGKDFSAEDKMLTGWDDDTNGYETWNAYTNELMYELCERYGERISGLWIDAFFDHIPKGEAQALFNKICKSHNPKMIIQFNVGLRDSEHIENPLPDFNGADEYRCWEFSHTENLEVIPLTKNQSAVVIGSQWFTDTAQSTEITINSAEEILRYLIGQASISVGGGFLASAGCYPDRLEDDLGDDVWQNGIKDTYLKIREYLDIFGEGIYNTNIGIAYPTEAGKAVNQLSYVSTESRDSKYVYIHILNSENPNTVTLPLPSDESLFLDNVKVIKSDGSIELATLELGENGYTITLQNGSSFDQINTMIKLERGDSAKITQADLRIDANLTVNFYAKLLVGQSNAKLRVTMNGKTTLLDGDLTESGERKYRLLNVNPQCIGDKISLVLVIDDSPISVEYNYSVKEYCLGLLETTAEELGMSEEKHQVLIKLIHALLEYGACAQNYVGYKTDSLVNDGIESSYDYIEVTESNKSVSSSTVEGVEIKAAGLRFANENSFIFLVSTVNVENTKLRISANGNSKEYCADAFVEDIDEYIAYTSSLLAIDFDTVYTIELIYNDTVVQVMTYSVYDYVMSQQNKTVDGELTAMAKLARALRMYGLLADEYFSMV